MYISFLSFKLNPCVLLLEYESVIILIRFFFSVYFAVASDGQLQSGHLLKPQQHAGGSMNSSSSSGSSSANILSSNNLSGQQQVMAEEVGRKRETRLLKNRYVSFLGILCVVICSLKVY